MEPIKRAIASFFDFMQGIVVFLSILVMIYLFLFSPQEVSGQSMFPTFHDHDLVITDKITYKINLPKRGDVVILKSPMNKEIDFIKRVIALPGETILLKNSKFYIDGKELPEPYLASTVYTGEESFLKEGIMYTVPEGSYFVCGDNRPHSSDSRDFGPIALGDLIGKVLFRYWPANTFYVVPPVTYSLE